MILGLQQQWDCCAQEMVLVRKDREGRLPDEVYQTMGPFSGDTFIIPSWIRWPGFWLFDVYCKVSGVGILQEEGGGGGVLLGQAVH